ncbi:MAG TPA: nuclear transport factor 2 family protein [Acidobacteriaceae bacterium]
MKNVRFAVISLLAVMLSLTTFGHGQAKVSDAVKAELVAAEAEMFAKIVQQDPAYMKNLVADDYFSINADGSTETKAQLAAEKDSPKMKMMAMATYQLFDKQIRAYGNVGIVNGRARAYMQGTYIVEFLYTAVFVKQNDKWMFTLWQGTISKDSPPPPPMPPSSM